jgi:hypothetical protein
MGRLKLTSEEQAMLDGAHGQAVQKSMEILQALGTIYGAERMLPVNSVQIAGVSFDNLGEAGLQFLTEMAEGGGKARVLTTLNPAGMDIEDPDSLGISPEFAENQRRVIEAFTRMQIIPTCTCTPYLVGNTPKFGDHIAWAESSAVCYANSVLGARTNREGGPSALAAALTGLTPEYGLHLDSERLPGLLVEVGASVNTWTGGDSDVRLSGTSDFGVLGRAVGEALQTHFGSTLPHAKQPHPGARLPYLRGVVEACGGKPTLEMLKSLCASLATYGGAAMFHMEGVTPEAGTVPIPAETIRIGTTELQAAAAALSDASLEEVDFVSLGCPHLTIEEIARIAELLEGKHVRREFWITTARPTRQLADRLGYSAIILASGARFATDTCCVVAPIRGRFHALATDSAKACYYGSAKNRFKTALLPFDQIVELALKDQGKTI